MLFSGDLRATRACDGFEKAWQLGPMFWVGENMPYLFLALFTMSMDIDASIQWSKYYCDSLLTNRRVLFSFDAVKLLIISL